LAGNQAGQVVSNLSSLGITDLIGTKRRHVLKWGAELVDDDIGSWGDAALDKSVNDTTLAR
jgi:hypothetical protein